MDGNYLDVYLSEKMGQGEIQNIQLCCHSGGKKIYTDRESGEKHSENLQLYALFYRILISFIYNYTHCLPIFAHLLLKHDKNIAVNEGIYNSVV